MLQYELRGQGITTTLPLDDCSLKRHVEDFEEVVRELFPENSVFDLCGFSFGGRVSLAIAAEIPARVRRIVATGVPAHRGAEGQKILKKWQTSLDIGDLETFMWQSMSDGFGEKFLARHERRLDSWVQSAVGGNRAEAIAALVRHTHTDDLSSPWHTVNLARRAAERGLAEGQALFLVGESDRIAPPSQCVTLAKDNGWTCTIIPDAGHTVPIEQPRLWRNAVVEHFGRDDKIDTCSLYTSSTVS